MESSVFYFLTLLPSVDDIDNTPLADETASGLTELICNTAAKSREIKSCTMRLYYVAKFCPAIYTLSLNGDLNIWYIYVCVHLRSSGN